MTIKYSRIPWPENIIGPKADYYIEVDGKRIGHVRGDIAGRASGTISWWHATLLDGRKVRSRNTFRDLKTEIEKVLSN